LTVISEVIIGDFCHNFNILHLTISSSDSYIQKKT
jgi:hypothetical protein